jgi:hypothetical protein
MANRQAHTLHSIEDYDNTITSLLEEIDRLQNRVRDLKRERNNLTPICRIPEHILTRIFEFLQVYPRPVRETWDFWVVPDLAIDIQWICVLTVCRYFKDVALANGKLWASINLDWQEDLISMCVHRAGQAPLSVWEHLGIHAGFREERIERMLAMYAPRAHIMELGGGLGLEVINEKAIETPLPHLRSLKYSAPRKYLINASRLLLGGA